MMTRSLVMFSVLVFQYKYQVNVDGTVAAYRFPYLMLGDSLVLKQDSPYYEHFYTTLRPWKHYVPVNRNLSDLLEKVKWAKVSSLQCHFFRHQQFHRDWGLHFVTTQLN